MDVDVLAWKGVGVWVAELVVVVSVCVVLPWVMEGWWWCVFVVVSWMACQVVWMESLLGVWHGSVLEWMLCWWSCEVLAVVRRWKLPLVLFVEFVVVCCLVRGVAQ